MALLFPLLLVLTLAFDRILAGISLVIFLPAFETEVAGLTVLYPFRSLLTAEVRSNRIQIAHNGIFILVLFSRFGVELSLTSRFRILTYQILSETK